MEKIGVEAIVTGLVQFLSSMNKIDSSITDLSPKASMLGKAFEAVGNVVQWLTGSVFRILEYTLGSLLASAIQKVVSSLQELIGAAIEAGNEFQRLQIRLKNFNFNAATESGMGFQEAMQFATKATKEQMTWLQKLAATTPYDLTDISNVYSLARSYNFADKEARQLTSSIADFAAGMGLGGTEIERIVVNFGQMVQQGKVTQREMNDLARGAFVPVNDVLIEMQKQTGLTGKAFDAFRNSGEGVQAFMEAFNSLTGRRFAGSTQAMARTWKGATDNVKDFISSIVGLDVIMPVMDTVGGYIADFLDVFTRVPSEAERVVAEMEGVELRDPFGEIVETSEKIGKTIQGIVADILGLGPSADDLAQSLVDGLGAFSDWLIEHKDDIVVWVQDAIAKVGEMADKISSFIENKIIPAFDRISQWVDENGGTIDEFFSTLGEIFGQLFADATSGLEGEDPLGALLDGLKTFMDFVIENKDEIIKWTEAIAKVVVYLTILDLIAKVLVSVLLALALAVTAVITPFAILQNVFLVVVKVIGLVYTAFNWLSALLMTSVSTAFLVLIVAIVGAIMMFKVLEIGFRSVIGAVQIFATTVITWFSLIKSNIVNTITQAVESIKNGDWFGAAKAIIDGMYNGIIINMHLVINALYQLVQNAIDAVKTALGISSPSTVFIGIGIDLVTGFAEGVTNAADVLIEALRTVLTTLIEAATTKLDELSSVFSSKFKQAESAVRDVNWFALGVQVVTGIINGIKSMGASLASAATSAANSATNAIMKLWNIRSPSKVFYGIGRNAMLGMVEGIANTSGLLTSTMKTIAASAVMQASVIPSAMYSTAAPSQSSTINNTSNYNLSVHTSAPIEPILADFAMLQAMNS